jgi:glycosyltransferase involved in cell wall biosynthesis
VRFSIVTPSFRGGAWLKLCIASVADQAGVEHEHIVQDACSDDGTAEWLASDPRVRAFVEKDAGMYDAVNRGFARATGDVLAYLNCDEQYLPGALAAVARAFEAQPECDAMLGDTIVVDAGGNYVCERRALPPLKHHTWVGTTLSYLTSGLFLRRRVVESMGLTFDVRLKDLGDTDWAFRAVAAGVRFGVAGAFTSVFTDTGANMNLMPNARREAREFKASAPAWVRWTAPLWVAHHRMRRLCAGHYVCRNNSYAIYTAKGGNERKVFSVPRPTFRWIRKPPGR